VRAGRGTGRCREGARRCCEGTCRCGGGVSTSEAAARTHTLQRQGGAPARVGSPEQIHVVSALCFFALFSSCLIGEVAHQ
jgi:hypothetical protein